MTLEDPKEFAARLAKAVTLVRQSPYIPGEPTPKQWAFLSDHREEVLYGGAAGGGKSWSLLAGALMYAHIPGYSAILFRRTYPDLAQPGGLIPMSHEWLAATDAKWSEVKKQWRFPGGGTLNFGHMETAKDKFKYQGGEYQYIGWDEVTQIPEDGYIYLLSRLRQDITMTELGVPLRVRCSANPGGEFHEWVNDRFVKVSHPDRFFIPSSYKENPHLDREAYAKQLSKLGAVERAQLEDGDWDIRPQGDMFNPVDITVVPKPRGKDVRRCRVWDLATGGEKSDWTVGTLMSIDYTDDQPEGIVRIEHIWREKADPGRMEKAMATLAKMDGRHVPILIEQERGSAGKLYLRHLRRDVLKGYTVIALTPTGHKEDRAMLPAAMSSNGRLEIVDRSFTKEALSELGQFPTGAHDDIVDTISYGTEYLTRRKRTVRKQAPEQPSPRRQAAPTMPGRGQSAAAKRWGISSPDYLMRDQVR